MLKIVYRCKILTKNGLIMKDWFKIFKQKWIEQPDFNFPLVLNRMWVNCCEMKKSPYLCQRFRSDHWIVIKV